MPVIGACSGGVPPRAGASPSALTVPSDRADQYPAPSGVAAMATMGRRPEKDPGPDAPATDAPKAVTPSRPTVPVRFAAEARGGEAAVAATTGAPGATVATGEPAAATGRTRPAAAAKPVAASRAPRRRAGRELRGSVDPEAVLGWMGTGMPGLDDMGKTPSWRRARAKTPKSGRRTGTGGAEAGPSDRPRGGRETRAIQCAGAAVSGTVTGGAVCRG